MDTPVFDFVRDYVKKDVSRLHMPGHKGAAFLGCEPYDLTEIRGADALYEADGILAESEKNAASLFGAARTFYSTEGSSHAIRAMVFLACQHRPDLSRPPVILAARNVHKAFLFACALADCRVQWLYPAPQTERSICSCQVGPAAVDEALSLCDSPPCAVYLTSPDYLGNTADIAGIAAVCRKHRVPLLVDNAHGAYLHFLQQPRHPMDLGAFLCCDSAHKTLPCLTGGTYLHLSEEAALQLGDQVRDALAVTGSTSPSYLILQSLDLCNRYLAEDYPRRLAACIRRLEALKEALKEKGIPALPGEPAKLVIDGAAMGRTGRELGELLRKQNGEPEFTDENYLVCMMTPENRERDYRCVYDALKDLPKRPPREPLPLQTLPLEQRLTIRQAIFAPHRRVPLEQAEGRVCGAPSISCPPAVPIAISGEVLTARALELFAVYGQKDVSVVAEPY